MFFPAPWDLTMIELRKPALVLALAALMTGAASAASAQLRWVQPLSPIPQAEIFFAEGAAALSDDARMVLDQEAKVLIANPSYNVIVYGHADPFEAGSTQGAWDLGLKRALAAMNYLIAEGVPAARLRPDSRGCDYLILTHDTPVTRARMRIVTTEIQLPPPHYNQSCSGLCG